MYIVFLKFSNNRAKAREFMLAHNEWLKRGFDEGIFLVAGTLQPQLGGAVLAHNTTLPDLEARVQEDPFVAHDVVTAELLEVLPSKVDPRLAFLLT